MPQRRLLDVQTSFTGGLVRGFVSWSEGDPASYFCVPAFEPAAFAAPIAKMLRRFRDWQAQELWPYRDLAFVGLVDMTTAHVLISHPGLPRPHVEQQLRRRYPDLILTDVPASPIPTPSAKMLAHLAARRRGFQPCRFVIAPMGAAPDIDHH